MNKQAHTWKFARVSGFDQVRLESGADLLALDQLDQKLWVALSCPTTGVEFDSRTLALIDEDNDGRIRAPDILAAVKWATAQLNSPDDLIKGSDLLPLSAINNTTAEGAQLLASARQILSNIGKPDADAISVADSGDTVRIFSQTHFNGDGVITPATAAQENLQAVIKNISDTLGTVADRSGEQGINQELLDQFFTELQAYSDWWRSAEEADDTRLPFGDKSERAAKIVHAVRAKVEDYFTRCRMAAFDSRATAALNRSAEEYIALADQELSANASEIADFPLAQIAAGKDLPLLEGVNPAWSDALAQLQKEVIEPLFMHTGSSKNQLSEAEWHSVVEIFKSYEAWLKAKQGAAVEALGLPRVREILAGDTKEHLTTLINQDKALEPEMNAIDAVERLVRYHRDLFLLLNNFVTFRDFYSPTELAIFQAGTLYLDSRSCELCVQVEDAAKHATLATLSKAYLAYCQCTRVGSSEKMTIAAAFTNGDSDQLMVGRNGIFYDRKGQDWDATITKIIDHPISIRQAILSPYKRFGRMVGEQIEKMASARDKAMADKASAGIANSAKKTDASKPHTPPTPFDIGKFVGIFAAIGLAIGAIGTALVSIFSGFAELVWWKIPLVILGVLVLISGASVVLAWLKLRQRNLGRILDANGWAVNARVKINIPFGASLTHTAKLPPNARRTISDPYKSSTAGAWLWVIIAIAIAIGGVDLYMKSKAEVAEQSVQESTIEQATDSAK
ncbi:MAG: hypothetical protein U1B30_14350 [Pseudomonadota bacterium]|nr:hypothetical protein [Pseudomonadota bacterium]